MSSSVARSLVRLALFTVLALSAASCGGDDAPPIDTDLGVLPDAAPQDVGPVDAGARDAGVCVPCAAGYTGIDSACTDVDECALGTDDWDRDPVAPCANTAGSFMCACPARFTSPAGDGRGVGGCLLSHPSLSSLAPSAGALSHRTVTTESGATRTYTVVVVRSPVYVTASNTGANDSLREVASLSADGTRLAVGAEDEDSSATGIDGNQADNSAASNAAVYVD